MEGGRFRTGDICTPGLIPVNVWQKPPQYSKVISLQLKKKRMGESKGHRNGAPVGKLLLLEWRVCEGLWGCGVGKGTKWTVLKKANPDSEIRQKQHQRGACSLSVKECSGRISEPW